MKIYAQNRQYHINVDIYGGSIVIILFYRFIIYSNKGEIHGILSENKVFWLKPKTKGSRFMHKIDNIILTWRYMEGWLSLSCSIVFII